MKYKVRMTAHQIGYAAARTMRSEDRFRVLDEQAIATGNANEWWRGFSDGMKAASHYHYLVPSSYNRPQQE